MANYVSRGQKLALLSKLKGEKDCGSYVEKWLDSCPVNINTRQRCKSLSPMEDAHIWIYRDADKPFLHKRKVSEEIGKSLYYLF